MFKNLLVFMLCLLPMSSFSSTDEKTDSDEVVEESVQDIEKKEKDNLDRVINKIKKWYHSMMENKDTDVKEERVETQEK